MRRAPAQRAATLGSVGLLCMALAACAAAWRTRREAPEMTPALIDHGRSLGFPEDSVRRGREVFASRCAECHTLPDPDRYTTGDWGTILPRMARRARLDVGAAADVRAFVLSARVSDHP